MPHQHGGSVARATGRRWTGLGAGDDRMFHRAIRCGLLVPILAAFLAAGRAGPESADPAPWGLPEPLLDGLTAAAEAYLERSYRFTCVETLRSVRYGPQRAALRERLFEYVPRGTHAGREMREFRLQIDPQGRAGKLVTGGAPRFPTADEWTQLFSVWNRPHFMYRDLGTRRDDFDLVREIEFRGWRTFTDGRDIREWEGVALVEVERLRLVEVRARPRNQAARLAFSFDRWARSWKISFGIFAGPWFVPLVTIRTVRAPLAYQAHVRFDHWREDIRLPTLLQYDTLRVVGRSRLERHRVSTRLYDGCHCAGEP